MQGDNENTGIFNGSVRQIKHELEKKNVTHIACGSRFNIVVTDENKLYGWGDNHNDQISIGQAEKYFNYVAYPREITTLSNKIGKFFLVYTG